MLTRKMAVAGQFYPARPQQLKQLIQGFFNQLKRKEKQLSCPKALIVPHAALKYSGQNAAYAYSRLLPFKSQIKHIVMFGPSHRHAFQGIALEAATNVETPLGKIKIQPHGLNAPFVQDLIKTNNKAHAQEHCLEVQWPLLQTVLDNFTLTPFVVGTTTQFHVAEIIDKLWGDETTLFVISTDLSHYHNASECIQIDKQTCSNVMEYNNNILPSQACGSIALNALLNVAKYNQLKIKQEYYNHSGMITGDNQSVVGYAAFSLYEQNERKQQSIASALTQKDKYTLCKLARNSILNYLSHKKIAIKMELFPYYLTKIGASFVSLHNRDKLRGCVGSLTANLPVAADIMQNSIKAATRDPRFTPVTIDEMTHIKIEISLLTPAKPLICQNEADCLRQLQPNQDGLILKSGKKQGTFLPLVWQSLPKRKDFLNHLKIKAGIPVNEWPDDIQIFRYDAINFSESDLDEDETV